MCLLPSPIGQCTPYPFWQIVQVGLIEDDLPWAIRAKLIPVDGDVWKGDRVPDVNIAPRLVYHLFELVEKHVFAVPGLSKGVLDRMWPPGAIDATPALGRVVEDAPSLDFQDQKANLRHHDHKIRLPFPKHASIALVVSIFLEPWVTVVNDTITGELIHKGASHIALRFRGDITNIHFGDEFCHCN